MVMTGAKAQENGSRLGLLVGSRRFSPSQPRPSRLSRLPFAAAKPRLEDSSPNVHLGSSWRGYRNDLLGICITFLGRPITRLTEAEIWPLSRRPSSLSLS